MNLNYKSAYTSRYNDKLLNRQDWKKKFMCIREMQLNLICERWIIVDENWVIKTIYIE